MQIIQRANVCAVNSIISELRANGFDINCQRQGDVWYYQLRWCMDHKQKQSQLSIITAETEKRIDNLSMMQVLMLLTGQPEHIREEFEGYIKARDVERIGQFILMTLYQETQANVVSDFKRGKLWCSYYYF